MTHPNDQEPRQDSLPPVDSVIQEARASSWHLPPSEPEPVKGAPEDSATSDQLAPTPAPAAPPPPAAPVSAAPASPPAPVPATSPAAPSAASTAATATPVAVHDPAHGAPPAHSPAAAAHGSGHADPHAAAGHGGSHGDAHAEAHLGPIDTAMWGAGVLATAIGLLVAICFVLATAGAGAY